jgi:hypothetical protein
MRFFCKIFVCFLFSPALKVDLNHTAWLLLLLRLFWCVVLQGRQGDWDAHFVRCNSNRRSQSRDFSRFGHLLNQGLVLRVIALE